MCTYIVVTTILLRILTVSLLLLTCPRYPFYFGAGVTVPAGWDWNDVACLESSPSAYNIDYGYALCANTGFSVWGGKSWVLTFSTKESNRAEVVCDIVEATAAHRGWGDISLASNR